MTNRFKGLDLKNRVPEELWMEVCELPDVQVNLEKTQEAVIKTILKKNKCKKAKWLPEALQIAEKRTEAKGKEKREDIPI